MGARQPCMTLTGLVPDSSYAPIMRYSCAVLACSGT